MDRLVSETDSFSEHQMHSVVHEELTLPKMPSKKVKHTPGSAQHSPRDEGEPGTHVPQPLLMVHQQVALRPSAALHFIPLAPLLSWSWVKICEVLREELAPLPRNAHHTGGALGSCHL